MYEILCENAKIISLEDVRHLRDMGLLLVYAMLTMRYHVVLIMVVTVWWNLDNSIFNILMGI